MRVATSLIIKRLAIMVSVLVLVLGQLVLFIPKASADTDGLKLVYEKEEIPLNQYPTGISNINISRDYLTVVTTDGKLYTKDGIVSGLSDVEQAYMSGPVYNNPHDFIGFIIKTDGTVWSWGAGVQLGRLHDVDEDGVNDDDSDLQQVLGLPHIKDIQISHMHVVALAVDGTVWTWGANNTQQLGTDQDCVNPPNGPQCDTADRILPAQVPDLSDVKSVSIGDSATIAVTNDGTLKLWGTLCNVEASWPYYSSPTVIDRFGSNIKDATLGESWGCSLYVLTQSRELYRWGLAGHSPNNALSGPKKIFDSSYDIESVKSSNLSNSHAARSTSGVAYRWGSEVNYNNQQLGGYANEDNPKAIGNIGTESTYFVSEYGSAVVTNLATITQPGKLLYSDGAGLRELPFNGRGDKEIANNSAGWYDVSSDGHWVVFERDGDVFKADIDGSNEQNLTNTPNTYETQPRWSPDIQKISFNTYNDESAPLGVSVMNADGTDRQLVIADGSSYNGSISPDGSKIVYEKYYEDWRSQIVVTNIDGTDAVGYGDENRQLLSPVWSPDGSKIAFVDVTNSEWNPLYPDRFSIIDADFANRKDLYVTTEGSSPLLASWSPDSQNLAIVLYGPDGGAKIGYVPAADNESVVFITTISGVSNLQWLDVDMESNQVLPPTNLSAESPTKNKPNLAWDAIEGASSYKIYRDGQYIGSSTTTSYTDQSAGDGTYTYYVTAVSGTDESQPSDQVVVVVDTVRPVVAFTAPISFTSPFTTGPTVTVAASDPGSGLQNLVIHVYKSSGQLLTTCGSANATQLAAGEMSCSLAALPAGSYCIKAGSFDKAGNNKTVVSPTFTINL